MSEPSLPAADTALADLARTLVAGGYRFVTATPATHARVNARPGNEQARSLIDVFGWSRPFEPGLLPPGVLELMRQGGVLAMEAGLCRSRVRLSTLHGMSFLHSAYPTSAADAVFFGPDTYRFADAIAGELAQGRPVRRAVDIGCGAGPGGIVVARARPEAELFMADINPAALRLARINAALNLPASPAGHGGVRAVESNLLAAIPGSFDLIVANPPYMVDPAERAYRHGGGPLGAGLSLAILDAALERLAPGGTLVLYTGAAVVNGDDPFQSAATARLSDDRFGWSYREMDPDVFGEELDAAAYAHADRIAAVVLTVSRKE
ncbi:MAG: methyltransferase [Janthinobacterium lividum]